MSALSGSCCTLFKILLTWGLQKRKSKWLQYRESHISCLTPVRPSNHSPAPILVRVQGYTRSRLSLDDISCSADVPICQLVFHNHQLVLVISMIQFPNWMFLIHSLIFPSLRHMHKHSRRIGSLNKLEEVVSCHLAALTSSKWPPLSPGTLLLSMAPILWELARSQTTTWCHC